MIALASPIVAASRIFGLADLPPHPPLLYFSSTMVSRVCFDRGRSYKWDGCCRASSCSKNTFSALTAFSACTLTAMPLASTNLTLFYLTSKVLHTPGSTQTNFYPQPVFTQTLFYTKHFLQNHFNFCTNKLLHTPRFAPTNLYKPVSHKSAFTQTSFYTNQLFHKPPFTKNHLLHQPALHNLCFGPVGQRPEGLWNAEGC